MEARLAAEMAPEIVIDGDVQGSVQVQMHVGGYSETELDVSWTETP
jgi:hypothetical protein